MKLEEVVVHQDILSRFAKLVKNGRLAHAYLFVGPARIGKSETALALAKLVNCEASTAQVSEGFCGQCPSCVRINSGNHPDVHVLEKGEEGSIKIEQIRDLLAQVQLRPFEARKKIFIIKNIEDLTPEAGNAILKTLEEPSVNSLLILTTSVRERNLDTIVSRCHLMNFYPASHEELEGKLKAYYHVENPGAHFLARFAEGSLGRARQLNERHMFERKNEMIDQFILAPDSEDFIKKVLADKDETKELLNVLLSWVHDGLLIKAGAEDRRLIHLDRLKELRRFEAQHTFGELQELHEEVVKTSRLLNENLNVKIPLMIIKEQLWAK